MGPWPDVDVHLEWGERGAGEPAALPPGGKYALWSANGAAVVAAA